MQSVFCTRGLRAVDGLLSCEDKFHFLVVFMLSKISFAALLNDLLGTCAGRTVRGVHIYKGENICIADEAVSYHSPVLA